MPAVPGEFLFLTVNSQEPSAEGESQSTCGSHNNEHGQQKRKKKKKDGRILLFGRPGPAPSPGIAPGTLIGHFNLEEMASRAQRSSRNEIHVAIVSGRRLEQQGDQEGYASKAALQYTTLNYVIWSCFLSLSAFCLLCRHNTGPSNLQQPCFQ